MDDDTQERATKIRWLYDSTAFMDLALLIGGSIVHGGGAKWDRGFDNDGGAGRSHFGWPFNRDCKNGPDHV